MRFHWVVYFVALVYAVTAMRGVGIFLILLMLAKVYYGRKNRRNFLVR